MIPRKILAETWYYSIPEAYEILAPFIAEMRASRDADYWGYIDGLVLDVIQQSADFFPRDPKIEEQLNRSLSTWKAQRNERRESVKAQKKIQKN